MSKNKSGSKHLNVLITPEMHDRLNRRAEKANMPVSILVRLWLAEKLKSKD